MKIFIALTLAGLALLCFKTQSVTWALETGVASSATGHIGWFLLENIFSPM